MDIKVGAPPPVGSPGDPLQRRTGSVEARVLAVRGPRRRRGDSGRQGPERRDPRGPADPATGRVLVLMIPDGGQLPAGIASGAYRVFLRFVKR